MRGKILGVLLTVIFCLGMLTPVAASPSAFTGNPASDNWLLQGNSLTLGTYIRSNTVLLNELMNFDVYSSAFSLDASSPLVGGQWQVGDLVLGLGLVSKGDHVDNYYHDPRMVAKFGSDTATFSPSTTLTPPGNGLGSFSQGAGTGGVQVDYKYYLDNGIWGQWVNEVWYPGPNLSGIIQTAANVYYCKDKVSTLLASADYGRVLGIFEEDTPGHFIPQSFEVALDLTYLSRENYSPTPSQTGKADMAWQRGSSDSTDAYVPNMGAVPVPGTLLLLGSGLVGGFGLRKRLRK